MTQTINQNFNFATDTATFAVFDPKTLSHRVDEDHDWWIDDLSQVAEVQDGRIGLVSLGHDGIFKVRVTTGKLNALERGYARDVVTLGAQVSSKQLFLGRGEDLPSGGTLISTDTSQELQGQFIELANGRYDVTIYGIDVSLADDDGKDAENKLADIVVVLKKGQDEFAPVSEEPRFFVQFDKFVFASKTKRNVLRLNITEAVKVWNTKRYDSGKLLKPEFGKWPCRYGDYDMLLEDMSQVSRSERCLVESIRVDEDKKIIYCKLIKKLTDSAEPESFIQRLKKKFCCSTDNSNDKHILDKKQHQHRKQNLISTLKTTVFYLALFLILMLLDKYFHLNAVLDRLFSG